MKDIYWIEAGQPGRLAIVTRPRGADWLEQDLNGLRRGGIDVLVSLLEPWEAGELGLSSEGALAEEAGMRFLSYPIPDRCTPGDLEGFRQFVSELADRVQAGQSVGAHCRGCIGRSTVLIASVMIALGAEPGAALGAIERSRGCIVPDTGDQREWIHNFRPQRPQCNPRVAFARSWQAETLRRRPLILPPRHFIYPHAAEDVERGALEVLVRPTSGGPFLATFALGFADPAAPTGLWTCPHPDELCAVAGGYAYVVKTLDPQQFTQIGFRPVIEVRPVPEHNLLLFAGHHALLAWGAGGMTWQSPRLSAEGVRLTEIRGNAVHGFGWDLVSDREVPFTIDLETGNVLSDDPMRGSARHTRFTE